MPDWYAQHFSLKGKTGEDRRSAFLRHLSLLIVFDVLLVVGIDVLLGKSLLAALIFTAAFTVIDLIGLVAEFM